MEMPVWLLHKGCEGGLRRKWLEVGEGWTAEGSGLQMLSTLACGQWQHTTQLSEIRGARGHTNGIGETVPGCWLQGTGHHGDYKPIKPAGPAFLICVVTFMMVYFTNILYLLFKGNADRCNLSSLYLPCFQFLFLIKV